MARQRGETALPRLDPNRPKSEQIRAALAEFARAREPGTPIPSERELAERFSVARMTIRQCLDVLETEAIVRRVPGRGTFVAEPAAARSDTFASYTAELTARGLRPGTSRVRVSSRAATGEQVRALDLAAGDKVYLVDRVRTGNGKPVSVSRSVLPAARFPGLDQLLGEGGSLYAELARQFAVQPNNAQDRVTVVAVTKRDAAALDLAPGSPVLQVDRVARDHAGVAIESSRSVYRPDRYVLHLHLERPR